MTTRLDEMLSIMPYFLRNRDLITKTLARRIDKADSVNRTEVLQRIISESARSGVRDLANARKVCDFFSLKIAWE